MPLSYITLRTLIAAGAARSFNISLRIRSAERSDRPSFRAIVAANPAGIEMAVAILGAEPEKAQNAEEILAYPGFGTADETHAAFAKIFKAADGIVKSSIGGAVERVDRKGRAVRRLRPRRS